MLRISKRVVINSSEIEFTAVRSQGPGGQNVNKVSTAVRLRFDLKNSSLPDLYKDRLLRLSDKRITREGIIIIKAQQHRSQKKNKEDALRRLKDLIKSVFAVRKIRRPTRPTKISQDKRLNSKSKRGQIKVMRQKIKEIE